MQSLYMYVVLLCVPAYAMLNEQDLERFHNQVRCNDIEYVADVLKQYKNAANQREKNKNTALHIAARESNKAMIKLLIDSGKASPNVRNKIGSTPLLEAALMMNHDAAAVLLAYGARPSASHKSHHFYTPLHLATVLGDIHMVRILINARARRGAHNSAGYTSLDLAKKYTLNNKEVVVNMLQTKVTD